MTADGPQMTGFTDNDHEADIGGHASVPGWEGILDPGETILWQGRPDQAFHVDPGEIPGALFGMFFAGFALVWMALASRSGGFFWMFGLIHFTVGVGIVRSTLYSPTRRRRRTWYTLTARRAFIATDSPRKGKELKSYPITPDLPITFQDGPPATIHFAREMRTGDKGRSYTVPIGFERIADGHKVLALLHKVQRKEAAT